MQPFGLQEWIHKLEEGEGTRWIKVGVLILGLVALATLFHVREARNFTLPEAMDAAQVARNLAEGRGFSTKFIRPMSVAMVAEVRGETTPFLKENHPDLAQPPLYPTILAGLMKVVPFNFEMPPSINPRWRYQPEIIIGLFNQILFFLAIFLVKKLGDRLFDTAVGWVSAIIFAATELFWQFTTSGLPTMLLVVLFLFLVWLLLRIEQEARPLPAVTLDEGELEPQARTDIPRKSDRWFLAMGLAVGVILAAMALTRYSMAWLVIPAASYLAIFGGGRRVVLTVPAVLVLIVALAPWVYRNWTASGTPFGTAGLQVHHGTSVFPGNRLERALPRNLDLELNKINLDEYPRKLVEGLGEITRDELPRFGGNWVAALFLAGLLVPFRNPSLARLRWFLAGGLVVLAVVQALTRSEAGAQAMPVSDQNLLAIMAPAVFIFGVGMFFLLLDQVEFVYPQLRFAAITVLILVCSLPLILRVLPPRTYPVAYPPYYPPVIQTVGKWMKEDELMMSDMPWAVAWYGNRQCIWTTLDYGNQTPSDYYRINDYQKPIQALYLTPLTTNSRFLADMLKSPEGAWGRFILESVLRTNVPNGYPLKKAPSGFFPDQLFLSDRVRWPQTN